MEDSMDFGDWSSVVPPIDMESIKVLVRIRPVDSSVETCVDLQSSQGLVIEDIDHKKTFSCHYDSVLGPNATQAQVYDIVKEYTHSVLQGVNCTIFAYGQTGSGKTHSMYGPPNYIDANGRETEDLGIIPRAIHHIFELSKSPEILDFQVHVSFVQIYNEYLYDMLRDGTMHAPLSIRGDGKEIYVQGLSEYNVKRVGDTLQLLKMAEKNRAVRETYMNQASSRSHSIFTINVEYKKVDLQDGGGEVSYKAKFNLVDLAGSEKWDTNRTMGAEHITEMTNINLSLHSLGKCIAALAKASRRRNKEQEKLLERSGVYGGGDDDSSVGKNTSTLGSSKTFSNKYYGNIHVPYRESKLTRLLEDSLGGNSKTIMIATISPARYNCDETISTLKFADRAKQVMIQATINEFRPVDHAVVKRLQQENELLKVLVRKLYEETGCATSIRQVITSSPFESLALASLLPLASSSSSTTTFLTSPVHPSQSNKRLNQLQQDVATSMSQFPANAYSQSSPSLPNSPTKKTGQQSQSMQTSSLLPLSDNHDGNAGQQESRLEYILSLERALNKEQVHAQHLAKKNETLIKELEAMKLMNMQLSFQPPLQQQHNQQSFSAVASNNTAQISAWQEAIMQIPESAVGDLNSSVSDLVRHNEELLTNTEQLQKVMQKFFKFQIEEDEMKRDILQIFEVIKRLKGYITAQRVNEHFASLQSLQETLQRLKTEMKQQQPSASTWNGKLEPLQSSNFSQEPYYQAPSQQHQHQQHQQSQQTFSQPSNSNYQHSNVWSPPIDSRATSASNNTSSRVSSAAINSAPSMKYPQFNQQEQQQHHQQPVFNHQDFDFYDEHKNASQGSYQHPQHRNANNSHSHYSSQQNQNQNQRYRQLAPLDSIQKSPSSDNNPNSSGGGGISFRVRQGPSSSNKIQQSQQPYQSGNFTNQQQHVQRRGQGSSNESVASAESVLGGLAIIESEEEAMAREFKEAKARQKKKEKLAQWMKEKEERAKAEQREQDEERKAMLEAEREKEAKRKEYVQKQKAKLNQYHDKVKHESEKIQELINLGIDPKSLNL